MTIVNHYVPPTQVGIPVKWVEGVSTKSSPSRKKPKKAREAIAQTSSLSHDSDLSRAARITLNKVGVIGRRSFLVGLPWVALVRLIPARTRLSTGKLDWSRESGRPSANCIFRTAARYDLIVCGASPQLAIAAAN